MKITKIRDVRTPERGTERSAGIDFFVPRDFNKTVLEPGEDVLIPSGIKASVPHGYALIAKNRSSVATSAHAVAAAGLKGKPNTPKSCLVVGACVVDEDYQGEIFIHVINVGDQSSLIQQGMKIAQFLLVPVSNEDIEVVSEDELFNRKTDRSDGGFGSTNE